MKKLCIAIGLAVLAFSALAFYVPEHYPDDVSHHDEDAVVVSHHGHHGHHGCHKGRCCR